jgi:gamma-glutamylcyclotransferase (GGCT)/AIG2-like uncharacterized protein YtfP
MLYFAYGSNMNLEHMRRLCGWHFRVLGPAKLKDYQFGPDGRGYANIRPKEKEEVWGVLFDLDQYSLDVLDQFEGFPDIFDRKQIKVFDNSGNEVEAWVYIEQPDHFAQSHIREEYMRRVVTGALENRLPEQWISFLNSFLNQ